MGVAAPQACAVIALAGVAESDSAASLRDRFEELGGPHAARIDHAHIRSWC
jgi:hypothetical protein